MPENGEDQDSDAGESVSIMKSASAELHIKKC